MAQVCGNGVINSFREPPPLAFPVTEQVASLAALEQCSAWIGSRRTRYNGVRHRHTHLTNAGVAIIKRQNNQKPRGRPVAAARCCFGELTCLNVQFGVFSSVGSFHGGIITARALPKLERRWNRTRCDCFCDPRRAYFRLFVQLTLERHDFDMRYVGRMTEKRKLKVTVSTLDRFHDESEHRLPFPHVTSLIQKA